MNSKETAEKVWEAFCGELTCFGGEEPPDDVKEALSTALKEVVKHLGCHQFIDRIILADKLEELSEQLEQND